MNARAAALAPLALLCPLLAACEVYYAPPAPSIDGAVDGLVPAGQPSLQIDFSSAIDPATLKLEVVPLVTDAEGNLADEDNDPSTTLNPFFSHDPAAGDTGGTGALQNDDTQLVITPEKPFPIGPQLAVLVEPGLSDREGHKTGARTRLPFAFALKCGGDMVSSSLPSGAYFFLFQIQKPVGIQIKILADVRVDPATGTVLSQFTSAQRNKDPSRCAPAGLSCKDTEVCRLLPQPQCVAPSEPAGSVDEYSDFVPHPDPPTGFSFTVHGCAQDAADGSLGLATLPTDLIVQQPPVDTSDLAITCAFTKSADGSLHGTGNCGAKDVKIGGKSAGPAEGTTTGRLIPPQEAPKDLPSPPAH
jgi:hypothetical protein